MLVIASLLSALAGASLGLIGGGGSILTVPILRYVLGLEAHCAVAMSMLVVATTSVIALIAHARRGRVRWNIGLGFGLFGMLGALLGTRLGQHIPAAVLLIGLAILMFGTAFAMLRPPSRPTAEADTHITASALLKLSIEGFGVGLLTGLLGAGGGFVIVPMLILLARLPADLAIGTSLVVVTMNAAAGFAAAYSVVSIDWPVALAVTTASVLGATLGSAVGARLSPAVLRSLLGWCILGVALFVLSQELPTWLGARSILSVK